MLRKIKEKLDVGTAADSRFSAWVKGNNRLLSVAGALVVVLTYISKEIVQSHFEAKIQAIEQLESEMRLNERLQTIEPNLRDELSRATDTAKQQTDQDATLFSIAVNTHRATASPRCNSMPL
jgi:hypothetical protein